MKTKEWMFVTFSSLTITENAYYFKIFFINIYLTMFCEGYIISAVMEMEIAMICLISENRVLSVILNFLKVCRFKNFTSLQCCTPVSLIFSVLQLL